MTLLTVHKVLFGSVVLVFGVYGLVSLSRSAAGDPEAPLAAAASGAACLAALLYLRWLARRATPPGND